MLGILLVLMAGVPARAELLVAAPEQVTVKELEAQDRYYIHGVFETPVECGQVWKVLSDYEGLKGVLSSLRSSRVLTRTASSLTVEQVLDGQFLFFHKGVKLLLNVTEEAPTRIDFTEAAEKPFRHYSGSWLVEPDGSGCRVDYTLLVSRGDMAPVFLERKLFRDNSRGMLHELRAEVSRRATQAPAPPAALPVGNGL